MTKKKRIVTRRKITSLKKSTERSGNTKNSETFQKAVKALQEAGQMDQNDDGIGETIRTSVSPDVLAKYVNKLNWKKPTKRQQEYVGDLIEDAGWAKNIIFCANTMRVLDGHRRIEVALSKEYKSIPVNVGWWTKEQGDLLLASLDPMTNMATVDPNALQSLTLSNLKAAVGKKKEKQISMMKDVNGFARSILKGKKDHLTIRESKKSIRKLIGESTETKRDQRIGTSDNEELYDTALRDDLLFPSEGNEYGLPDLLPSKLFSDVSKIPSGTFARDGNPLTSSMYYCHNARPFDSATHLKPIGGVLGFYCEDKRLEGVKRRASEWAEKLVGEQWGGILEPDFSTYWDWPFACRLWSVYCSRWCARYWQQLDIAVIPILRRTNDIKRDEWLYSSLPDVTPIAAMQLRMGGKRNTKQENYWKGIGAVLKYMVKKKGLQHVMFYANPSYEKYILGFIPDGLDYTFVTPFIDARKLNRKKKQ